MNDLRTSFHRVADAVEPLPVDADLWQRGVAARRRGQAFLVAAVLAIVVSVAGTATLLGGEDREARTASREVVEGGAIPSTIVDPGELEPETDLAVGRASAAFVSAAGDVVVVTATDGVPHSLAVAFGPDRVALALSPDGRTLAFQEPADDGTRVVLLDLETGRPTPLLVHPGDRLELDGLSWSPSGDWLSWTASAVGDVPSYAGQVRLTGAESRRIAPAFNAVSVAVADDGTIALGSVAGAVFTRSGRTDQLERVPTELQSAPGAFSPGGAHLALATGPGASSYTLDMASRTVLAHPFPDGTIDTAVVRPLGWMDDRLEVLLVQDADGGELVVTTPEVDSTSTWRRSVGQVDGTIMSSLSLAVDLIPDLDGTSSQQLTHDFPVPAERDISWIIGLGVAAAIAVLMGLRWLWRRFLG